MLTLTVSLSLLALLDSLNPATLLTGVLLLNSQRPLLQTSMYTLGVFAAYFALGLAVVFGLGLLGPQSQFFAAFKLCLGVAFLMVAVWFSFKDMPSLNRTLGQLNPLAMLVFGVMATAQDFPTAFPYLAALELVTTAGLGWLGGVLMLGCYNLIYIAPLLVLLGIYAHNQQYLHRIQQGLDRFLQRYARKLTLLFMYPIGMWFLWQGLEGIR